MPRLACLAILALAGCPPPPRYAVVDVVDCSPHGLRPCCAPDVRRACDPEPVSDALVAADCGKLFGSAARTDDSGRARLAISGDPAAERCVVTVAKPGYPTIANVLVQLCSTVTACPPTLVSLAGLLPMSRAYAQPPGDLR